MEILLKILMTYLAVSTVRGQQCSYEIGYTDFAIPETVGPLESAHVYINVDDPVQCSGKVYAWFLCPLLEIDDEQSDSFDLVLAMYRFHQNGNLIIVKRSYYELNISEEEFIEDCIYIHLERSEWFDVVEGDVVAACWYEEEEEEDEEDETLIELAVHRNGKNLAEFEPSFAHSCSESHITLLRENNVDTIDDHTLLLTAFINIDECALDMDICHENATCSDVIGSEDSYNCTCNTGYTGDGFSCIANKRGTENDTDIERGTENDTDIERGTESDTDDNIATEVDEEGTLHNSTDGNVGGTNPTNQSSSQGGNSVIIGVIVAMFLLIIAVVTTAVVLVMLYLSRKRIESTISGNGTNRGSTKRHTDTLAVAERENEYDYVTVTDRNVPQQNQLIPFDYLRPSIRSNKKEYAETDYYIPMQSKGSVRDSGKCQPNTASQLYEELSHNKTFTKPSVNEAGNSEDTGYAVVNRHYTGLIQQTIQEHIYEALSPYKTPASKEDSLYAEISSYSIRTIPRECIEFISHLGTGQFGSVSKAVWRNGSEQRDVAVKTLTDSANTVKFLQEAAIMAQFKHPNIVTLHGVVSAGNPKIMVVELMDKGDLKAVVINMRPNPGNNVVEGVSLELLHFSKQVALGLHYLACRGYVHRDLAARNILVSSDNLCKIADFGLSRDLADDDIYVSHGGKIPLKWCAPEAIFQRKYSTASDVWSYGCVLYEIWSLGHKPFESHQTKEVPQLVKKGYRLPPPPGCPKKIYELMIKSWHPDASTRPRPRDLLQVLVRDVDEVMEVPVEDVPAGSQAAVLGAPLNAASQLYTQLQNMYSKT